MRAAESPTVFVVAPMQLCTRQLHGRLLAAGGHARGAACGSHTGRSLLHTSVRLFSGSSPGASSQPGFLTLERMRELRRTAGRPVPEALLHIIPAQTARYSKRMLPLAGLRTEEEAGRRDAGPLGADGISERRQTAHQSGKTKHYAHAAHRDAERACRARPRGRPV